MTLCAFRVESARKGAISKAQRSFCERRRQVLDETSTRTQLERWPGFGHRWSRLQKHVTLIRNAPRGAFQSSHESVCECAEPGRPAAAELLREPINQHPSPYHCCCHSTVAATAAPAHRRVRGNGTRFPSTRDPFGAPYHCGTSQTRRDRRHPRFRGSESHAIPQLHPRSCRRKTQQNPGMVPRARRKCGMPCHHGSRGAPPNRPGVKPPP